VNVLFKGVANDNQISTCGIHLLNSFGRPYSATYNDRNTNICPDRSHNLFGNMRFGPGACFEIDQKVADHFAGDSGVDYIRQVILRHGCGSTDPLHSSFISSVNQHICGGNYLHTTGMQKWSGRNLMTDEILRIATGYEGQKQDPIRMY